MKFIALTDNRALPINRKQKVFPNGTLIIENVERNSDQATYTCVAKNAEGYSARGALEVQVMGKLIEYQIYFIQTPNRSHRKQMVWMADTFEYEKQITQIFNC